MRLNRRYLTFSLRTLFVLLTALAVWLGVVINRAREQREAVKAIEALGGEVAYDWAWDVKTPKGPTGPAWLRRLIGDDFFQTVERVSFYNASDCVAAIPDLRRLRELESVSVEPPTSKAAENAFKAALPNCELEWLPETVDISL